MSSEPGSSASPGRLKDEQTLLGLSGMGAGFGDPLGFFLLACSIITRHFTFVVFWRLPVCNKRCAVSSEHSKLDISNTLHCTQPPTKK